MLYEEQSNNKYDYNVIKSLDVVYVIGLIVIFFIIHDLILLMDEDKPNTVTKEVATDFITL